MTGADGNQERGWEPPALSRRTVAKLSGLAAGGFAAILGVLTDAVDIEVRADSGADESGERIYSTGDGIQLPRPGTAESTMHVSDAIADRRSRREYGTAPVTLAELGQLLWATQGITERQVGRVDLRAAPSAGATYPLDVFAVPDTPGVEGLEPGVYQYRPDSHELGRLRTGAFGAELQDIAIDQEWVGGAALNIVITAVDERTTQRYGLRGRRRYVPMEAGHAGQNLYLQAEALELSTVAIGAFRDEDLLGLLGVGEEHRPLYIYPVGRRR